MKKSYELLQVNVISLENEDVIATSTSTAIRNNNLCGEDFSFGDLGTQEFSQ